MTFFPSDQGKLGPDNSIWDDGEWISWAEINSHLAAQELRVPTTGPVSDAGLGRIEALSAIACSATCRLTYALLIH